MNTVVNTTQNQLESMELPRGAYMPIPPNHPVVVWPVGFVIDKSASSGVRTRRSFRKTWGRILGRIGAFLNGLNMSSVPKDVVDPRDFPQENPYDRSFSDNWSGRY